MFISFIAALPSQSWKFLELEKRTTLFTRHPQLNEVTKKPVKPYCAPWFS